jgi:hypothetical protein
MIGPITNLALVFSADNFADSIVDEKISISNYSLSASVSRQPMFECFRTDAVLPRLRVESSVVPWKIFGTSFKYGSSCFLGSLYVRYGLSVFGYSRRISSIFRYIFASDEAMTIQF